MIQKKDLLSSSEQSEGLLVSKIQNESNFLPYAHDIENEYRCYQCNINDNPKQVERIRAYIEKLYSEAGYRGFSRKFDREFDSYSETFYVLDQNDQIVSTQRVTKKLPNKPISIEYGIIKRTKDEHYKFNLDGIVEFSSLGFTNARAISLMYACIADHCIQTNVNKAYGLYDASVLSTRRLFERVGASFEREYNRLIYFPSYKRNGVPVHWAIMSMERDHFFEIRNKHEKDLTVSSY